MQEDKNRLDRTAAASDSRVRDMVRQGLHAETVASDSGSGLAGADNRPAPPPSSPAAAMADTQASGAAPQPPAAAPADPCGTTPAGRPPGPAELPQTRVAAGPDMQKLVAHGVHEETAASGAAPDAALTRIGKYSVTRQLGKGGMGAVYLGHHPDLDLPVAIKVIDPQYARDPVFRERFLVEARLASRINHPHVVRVYDADQDQGRYFMVQEYVGGGDATTLLKSSPNGRLPPSQALAVVTDTASALVAAEGLNIVHRDVKPRNILLTEDGKAKLADLGLAKQLQPVAAGQPASIEITQAGATLGSPAYMAPEQIGDSRRADIRSDIYSLGVTFYELLTGELPFAGSTAAEVMLKHMHEPITDPRRANPQVSARLARIIRHMTAKRPEERYQTAAALLAALQAAAKPAWRTWAPALAAAALVLAALIVGALLNRAPAGDAVPQEAIAALAAGDAAKAVPLLEQALARDPANPRTLYALGLCRLEARDSAGLREAREQLATLPDGTELARHLELLESLEGGDADRALAVAQACEKGARYGLIFQYGKGLAYLKQRDLPKAKACLSAAVQQAALFDFQRFAAIDALARLFVAEGKTAEASSLYANAVRDRTGGPGPSPSFYTNYAVTLMNGGKPGEAAEPLRLALQLEPKQDLAQYLQRQLARQQAVSEQVQKTMAMVDEVSTHAKARLEAQDEWTSSPIVLVFLPPETERLEAERLGEERLWVDSLAEQIGGRGSFPVVDRDVLDQVLREQQISASDLGSAAAQVKLGKLFPASVLVKSRFSGDARRVQVQLQLVDVATSEVVAFVREDDLTSATRQAAVASLADRLMLALVEPYPVHGKVLTVDGQDAEINVGRCHGLRQGQTLKVQKAQPGTSARLLAHKPGLARATVTSLDRFGATVRLEAGAEPVAAGMLVLAEP